MLKTPFERDGIRYIPGDNWPAAKSVESRGQHFMALRPGPGGFFRQTIFVRGSHFSRADVVAAFAELVEGDSA